MVILIYVLLMSKKQSAINCDNTDIKYYISFSVLIILELEVSDWIEIKDKCRVLLPEAKTYFGSLMACKLVS